MSTARPDKPCQARYYSAAEDALLLQLGAEGVDWNEVHQRLGKSSPDALRARYLKIEPPEARARRLGLPAPRPPGGKRRDCMVCGRSFESVGAHNRLCDPCRETAW